MDIVSLIEVSGIGGYHSEEERRDVPNEERGGRKAGRSPSEEDQVAEEGEDGAAEEGEDGTAEEGDER